MIDPIHALPPGTVLGPVALTTPNLERAVRFYIEWLGLELYEQDSAHAILGAGAEQILILEYNPAAQPVKGFTGLYHLAILVPSRLELARSLRRLIEKRYSMQGFGDHGVSEAIYLADLDGNGIEIYRDYPRSVWPYRGNQLQMITAQADIEGVLKELRGDLDLPPTVHPGTRLGHVHLSVSNVALAEAFYCDVLGFDLVQRFGSAARFVSAGGYHHHVGFNTWNSAGALPAPPGSVGLSYFTIKLPYQAALERVRMRCQNAGIESKGNGSGFIARDPSGINVWLTV